MYVKDFWSDKNIRELNSCHQTEKNFFFYTLVMIPTKLRVSALNCETLMNRVRMGIFVRVSLPGSCRGMNIAVKMRCLGKYRTRDKIA